jgi:hypothetical protein
LFTTGIDLFKVFDDVDLEVIVTDNEYVPDFFNPGIFKLKLETVKVVSNLKICLELSVQFTNIEYKAPAAGIFELTVIVRGSVSITLKVPVSKLVVNFIASS